MFTSVDLFNGRHTALIAVAVGPAILAAVILAAPLILGRRGGPSRSMRLETFRTQLRLVLIRLRAGMRVFREPRLGAIAVSAQLGAWGLQCASCYVLLIALGLDHRAGLAAAAGVLFAVNVTAVLPAAPSNLGVFQAACVAVLAGAFHVSTADAIAYGIVLQAIEVTTAVVMGIPALLREGMSWRDVKLRAMHTTPVTLQAPEVRGAGGAASTSERTARHGRPAAGDPAPVAQANAMSDAWVYILRCADGSLYTGWTVDLERRLASHAAGDASRYTRSRLPVELVASFAMADASAARREEARIKRLPRAAKLALLPRPVSEPGRPVRGLASAARRRSGGYLMNSISEYFGSGQRSSATTRSSRSAIARTPSMAGTTSSRMYSACLSPSTSGCGRVDALECDDRVDEPRPRARPSPRSGCRRRPRAAGRGDAASPAAAGCGRSMRRSRLRC